MRRPERLAGSLKEEIAEVVGFELDDPRLEMVTVTDVEVTKDLRDAKVFVLISGTQAEIDEALKTLRRAATFIRQQVAINLDMRFAPHIHFARDDAEENAARVSELLTTIDIKKEGEEGSEVEV